MLFNTSSGHYEYLVMLFWLIETPEVFQAFGNDVCDMLNQFLLVYLEAILFPAARSNMWDMSSEYLRHLLQYQLFVKANKCEFHRSVVWSLRFFISPEKIAVDLEKVNTVLN